MNFSRKKVTLIAAVLGLTASLSFADRAWDQYLNLNPIQKQQLNGDNKTKSNTVKPARADRDAATQTLITQILGNAGDSAIQPLLTQIFADTNTIDSSEDSYWPTISQFLSPTQVAKIFLKNHQPQNPPPAPAQPAMHPPKYNWTAYFGLTSTQQTQYKTDDQEKGTAEKELKASTNSLITQLNQQVQSNAGDGPIQPTLNQIFGNLQNQQQTELTFWTGTLPAFLTPTQIAKIYLHRHAPKGTFNPPPVSAPPSN